MTQSHFVELKNIVKRFGTNTVIDTLSLSIPQGKWFRYWGHQVAVKRQYYA